MDENAAVFLISSLEDRIKVLNETVMNLETSIHNYRAFMDKIPCNYPENSFGSPDMTSLEWVEWAKMKLGYDAI